MNNVRKELMNYGGKLKHLFISSKYFLYRELISFIIYSGFIILVGYFQSRTA